MTGTEKQGKNKLKEFIMTKINEDLISIIESLPVDVKIQLADNLLNSLYPKNDEIDKYWIEEAEKRVKELKEGKIKTIPSNKVLTDLKKKYDL